MAPNVTNACVLTFSKPANGIVSTPGFTSEFSGADWPRLESRFFDAADTEYARLHNFGKEYLWHEPNSGGIILRPNLEPVDMDGATVGSRYLGSYYECGGGAWARKTVFGFPEVECEFQSEVQTKVGEAYQATDWTIVAGEGQGAAARGTAWGENQGFVCWIAKNLLPANERNVLKFHLLNVDGRGQPDNGVYIEIIDGKELAWCHYLTIQSSATVPPTRAVQTQWEASKLSPGKKLYQWSGDVSVYGLFFVGRYVILSVNGLEQTIALRAQNYELGTDANDREYPVLLRAGATLYIAGKGQALIGWKKAVYASEGNVETPLVFPSYTLSSSASVIASKSVQPAGTAITTRGVCGGYLKLGGQRQVGPLAAGDDARYGVFADATLIGPPQDPTLPEITEAAYNAMTAAQKTARLKREYYRYTTEVTPILYRWKIHDPRALATSSATPADPLSDDIVRYSESMSGSPDGIYNGGSCTVDLVCTDDEYAALIAEKLPVADVRITPRGSETPVLRSRQYFDAPEFSVPEHGDQRVSLKGSDVVKRLQELPVGTAHSFDDYGWTHVHLMVELGRMAGVTVNYPTGSLTTADLLPVGEDAKNPVWQFQPGVSVWEAMQKARKVSGWLLYPEADGSLRYKPVPAASGAADFAFGRAATYPAAVEIKYRVVPLWKTRITVTGKAGKSTADFREGDVLSGLWRDRVMETEIGMTLEHTEADDTLSDWTAIEARGDALDAQFNGPNLFVSFMLTDARAYLSSLWLYKVFSWADPAHAEVDEGKFLITSLSLDLNAFDCTATIEGKKLT